MSTGTNKDISNVNSLSTCRSISGIWWAKEELNGICTLGICDDIMWKRPSEVWFIKGDIGLSFWVGYNWRSQIVISFKQCLLAGKTMSLALNLCMPCTYLRTCSLSLTAPSPILVNCANVSPNFLQLFLALNSILTPKTGTTWSFLLPRSLLNP